MQVAQTQGLSYICNCSGVCINLFNIYTQTSHAPNLKAAHFVDMFTADYINANIKGYSEFQIPGNHACSLAQFPSILAFSQPPTLSTSPPPPPPLLILTTTTKDHYHHYHHHCIISTNQHRSKPYVLI